MRLPLQTCWWRRRMVRIFLGVMLCLSCSWSPTALAEAPRSTLFPLPEILRPNVTFWKRIFAAFDTNGGVLHDPSDVTIVYEVWYNDLPNDSQLRQSIIDEARTRYRTALLNLAEGKRVDLNSDEERLWRMFQGKQQPAIFRTAANNLRFQGGMRSRFAQGLLRSWSYLPEFESIFVSMGLPQELTMLPHVESSFENRALSKAGAAGIWQFMPATGRRFLRVDSRVDERLNVRQATIAAARLLRENYELLGTWPLAITAYNHGASGMKQAVAAVGSTDFGLIVQQYRGPLFGFASQNFYAEFLAAVEVATNYQQYFDDLLLQAPPERVLSVAAGGPDEAPTQPVPMARYDALTPPGHVATRHLPAGLPYVAPVVAVTLVPAAAEPAAPSPGTAVALLPPIIESDTFSTPRAATEPPAIVLTASVPSEALEAPLPSTPSASPAPALRPAAPVDRSTLVAPVPAETPPTTEAPPARLAAVQPRVSPLPTTAPAAPAPGLRDSAVAPSPAASTGPAEGAPALSKMPSADYRVRPGESLFALAQRYNTTVAALAALNKLPARAELQAGQVLKVPALLPGPVTQPPPVRAAEKVVPASPSTSSILAVITAGKPARTMAEATHPSLPVSQVPALMPLQAAGGPTQGTRLPAPDERFQVHGESIRVAAQEQLGQYASWLEVPVRRLQTLNRLQDGQVPAIGSAIRLDFSKVSAAQFTQKRLQYQRGLEEAFLRRYRVGAVLTRKLKPGETLLSVSRQAPGLPLWLLQRYNTHLDANTPKPGGELHIPQVSARAS